MKLGSHTTVLMRTLEIGRFVSLSALEVVKQERNLWLSAVKVLIILAWVDVVAAPTKHAAMATGSYGFTAVNLLSFWHNGIADLDVSWENTVAPLVKLLGEMNGYVYTLTQKRKISPWILIDTHQRVKKIPFCRENISLIGSFCMDRALLSP